MIVQIIRWKLFYLLLLFLTVNVYSQDKHDYVTPLEKNLYHKVVQDANGMVLPMTELSTVSAGKDGLALVFYLRTVLKNVKEPLKLVSFMMGSESNTFMEIYYHNGTLSFHRRINLLEPNLAYDYELFDPLFDISESELTTKISIFFTSSFFWIETGSPSVVVADKRHSAIFFGIDPPTYTFMNKFLTKDLRAKVKFGDPNSKVIFTMPEEVNVYEFNYKNLKNELQAHFCDNN